MCSWSWSPEPQVLCALRISTRLYCEEGSREKSWKWRTSVDQPLFPCRGSLRCLLSFVKEMGYSLMFSYLFLPPTRAQTPREPELWLLCTRTPLRTFNSQGPTPRSQCAGPGTSAPSPVCSHDVPPRRFPSSHLSISILCCCGQWFLTLRLSSLPKLGFKQPFAPLDLFAPHSISSYHLINP